MGLPFLASSNDFEKEINFTGTSTITNGNIQLIPLSTGLGLNVPTSGDFRLSVNGTTALTLSASLATLASTNGLYFTGTTGTVTGSQRMVVPTSTGININVPTSKDLRISVNDGVSLTIDVDGFIVPQDKYGYFGAASIKAGSDAIMQFNTPTGNGYAWTASSTVVLTSDVGLLTVGSQHGIKLDSSTGTVTAANRQIAGTSYGLGYNVPGGTSHSFRENNVEAFAVNSTAVYIKDTLIFLGTIGLIQTTSSDGSDSGILDLSSYGALGLSPSRGASIRLVGNENIDLSGHYPGSIVFSLGNVTGAQYRFASKYGHTVSYYATIDETGLALPAGALSFSSSPPGTSPGNVVSIFTHTDAVMQFNTPTGNGYAWTASSTVVLTSDVGLLTVGSQHGIKLDSSTGTVTAANRQVTGTSTGINLNTPSATVFTFLVNNVSQLTIGTTGLVSPLQAMRTNATSATLANSSTTAVLTLSGNAGRVWFTDNAGGWAVFRYDATTCTFESGSADWSATASPGSAAIGVAVASGIMNVYVGSAATRKIGWHIKNVVL